MCVKNNHIDKCENSIVLISSDGKLIQKFKKSLPACCNFYYAMNYSESVGICKKYQPHILFIDQCQSANWLVKFIVKFNRDNPGIVLIYLTEQLYEPEIFLIWGKVRELIKKPVADLLIKQSCEKYCLHPNSQLSPCWLAMQMIGQNFSNPSLTEKSVALKLGFRPDYFSHLFKSKFGKSFHQFLLEKRIEISKELLGNDDMKIKEIAHRVGYLREDSFDRAFRKKTGETPGDYRHRLRYHI